MPRPEKVKPLPSVETIAKYLEYFPNTGSIYWRDRDISTFTPVGNKSAEHLMRHYQTRFAGKPAGSTRKDGYATIMIEGVHYKRSRLAWKIMKGEDPFIIDHINGNRSDDRIENLRSVSPTLNARNAALYLTNTSGFPGVEWHSRDETWTAKIGVGGFQRHLGNFKSKEEAIAARIGAQVILDYHENHGRSGALS